MKPTILIVALLIAGCTEQAVEKRQEIPKHWSQTVRDSIEYYYIFQDGELVDNCDQMRDFAAWCQKAHPDVWREYYSTTTKGR